MISGGELCDAVTDALYDAGRLVAKDAREQALGVLAAECVVVGVAQRRRRNLYAHLHAHGRPPRSAPPTAVRCRHCML